MKLGKLGLAVSAVALGLFLQPNIGWSTRAYAPAITGTVTAAPSGGTIEIDHRIYHIKAGSTAATLLSSLYVGEVVDMIVDGPPGGTIEVIMITEHKE
jgi:hypothetical protein